MEVKTVAQITFPVGASTWASPQRQVKNPTASRVTGAMFAANCLATGKSHRGRARTVWRTGVDDEFVSGCVTQDNVLAGGMYRPLPDTRLRFFHGWRGLHPEHIAICLALKDIKDRNHIAPFSDCACVRPRA